MPLSGTWLYIGNHPVMGGTGSSPINTAAEMNKLEGVIATHQGGLSFVEVTWTTNSSNIAYPMHNMTTSTFHHATYDAGNGTVTSAFAAFMHYEVELTFLAEDGSTYTSTHIYTVRQTVNGDTFITPSDDFGDPTEVFTDPLLSVTLVDRVGPNWNYSMSGVRDFTPGGEVPPVIAPCFATGTLILTRRGSLPVETIRAGDEVWTADHGFQTVRWVGGRQLDPPLLRIFPNLRPVRISAGALGDGLPLSDLVVSRQHRIVLRSMIAERMFGQEEVLVAAKDLLTHPGIRLDEAASGVGYHHLLLDRHEILCAEGVPTESLYLGQQGLIALGAEGRREVMTIFPELQSTHLLPEPARPIPDARQARRLLERHLRNGKGFSLAA